ncbi:14041_t:CDS:1, partial [Acaulospora colombiana]
AQEVKGYDHVIVEQNISLKNLSWRHNSQKNKKGFDADDMTSVFETIEFAREVAKS